jgi:hypothetical protein
MHRSHTAYLFCATPLRNPPRIVDDMRTVLVLVLAIALASCTSASPKADRDNNIEADERSSKLTIEQVVETAYRGGFRGEKQLLAATAIAVAESSLVPNQRNWHPEYGLRKAGTAFGVEGPSDVWNSDRSRQLHSDRGIWQISSHWWGKYSDAQTDDPDTAARIAYAISKKGTDFTPWDTYKNGAAQKHYDEPHKGWPAVRPAVRAFLQR